MQASPLFARFLPAEMFGGGAQGLTLSQPEHMFGVMTDDEVTPEVELAAQVAVARAELAEVRALLLRLAAALPPHQTATPGS